MTLLLLAALAPAASALEIPHEAYTLDNGLQVVLAADDRLPQVVVDLWYAVGSLDDPAGRSGFAHLFEHLLFRGTQRIGEGEFDARMEAAGGWNNAWTSRHETNYYSVGPSHALDLLLWLEADRMTGLDITQEKLDLEREVVRNERRQMVEDRPYGEAWLAIQEMAFPPGHPAGRSTIGTHEELMAATLEDVRAFYETWYVPGNAILTVVGDFEPEAARAAIEATFGTLPARPLPEGRALAWPDAPAEAHRRLTDEVSLPAVYLFWMSPAHFAPGDAAHDVLAHVLTGSEDARLSRRLQFEDRSVQGIDAAQYSGPEGSFFILDAVVASDHEPEAVVAAIREELSALAGERPPTEEEVERAQNHLELSLLYEAESFLGRALLLATYQAVLGHPDHLAADVARVRAVTPEEVRAVAERLIPGRGGRVDILPAPGEEASP